MPSDQEIEYILGDSGLSDWFKTALRAALKCDPVQAAHDAGLLSLVLDQRVQETRPQRLAEKCIARAMQDPG